MQVKHIVTEYKGCSDIIIKEIAYLIKSKRKARMIRKEGR